MFPRYKGRPIISARSKKSHDEIMRLGLTLEDIKQILENGYDCHRSKRKPNILEKCVHKRKKVIKVVVAKRHLKWIDGTDEPTWVVIHVGEFTYKRR